VQLSQYIQGVSKLPFQVQIYFTKLDGSKCIRVISRHQDITTERSEAENNINIGVVGLHSVRETAKLAEEGNYSKARMKTMTHQNMVKRAIKNKKEVTDREKKTIP